MSEKRRIIKKNDGSIEIIIPVMKNKKDNETLEEFYNRVFDKVQLPRYDENENQVNELYNLPYEDIDSSLIPQDRTNRNEWRKDPGKNIEVDQVKKALKDQKKIEKLNKKNDLKTKLNLDDTEIESLKEMLK